MIKILHNVDLCWVKNVNFFANFFSENVIKIITSFPGFTGTLRRRTWAASPAPTTRSCPTSWRKSFDDARAASISCPLPEQVQVVRLLNYFFALYSNELAWVGFCNILNRALFWEPSSGVQEYSHVYKRCGKSYYHPLPWLYLISRLIAPQADTFL
jgi:hypothetical protein